MKKLQEAEEEQERIAAEKKKGYLHTKEEVLNKLFGPILSEQIGDGHVMSNCKDLAKETFAKHAQFKSFT